MNLTLDQVRQIWLDTGLRDLSEKELVYLMETANTRGTALMDGKNAEQWVTTIANQIIAEATEDSPHEPGYMLLVQYRGAKEIHVMHTNTNGVWRQCLAKEGNQHLLIEMGDRLIDENLIDSYQLIKTAGNPVIAI